jgi:hypothetical protein
MKHPNPRTWYVVTDDGHARFLRKQDGYETFDTLHVFAAAYPVLQRTGELLPSRIA